METTKSRAWPIPDGATHERHVELTYVTFRHGREVLHEALNPVLLFTPSGLKTTRRYPVDDV